MPPVDDQREQILAATSEQVAKQTLASAKLLEITSLAAALGDLGNLLSDLPAPPAIKAVPGDRADTLRRIGAGTAPYAELADVVVQLQQLRRDLVPLSHGWLLAGQASATETAALDRGLIKAIAQARQLLAARPDVTAIMEDLSAIKHLRGGPADAVAFHDFHVLQIAFKSVWLHLFDRKLRSAVEQLYEEIAGSGIQSDVAEPALDASADVTALKDFLHSLTTSLSPSSPEPALRAQPPVVPQFGGVQSRGTPAGTVTVGPPEIQREYEGRLITLIKKIGEALNEPYSFDVFGPGTYNYGLMITYRQKWEPGEYQAGDLAATIPLAPGETRKFTKKRVVKESVSRKVAEKSSQLRSLQTSDTSRAESEIMNRATTATNFKMTTRGSFNIGIGSFDTTNEFGGSNEMFSSTNKKAFHEATLKAAEEYRLERSLEIDTNSAIESEETTSGEISNPNNEITVTYLFYELQRRYKIHEYLHRVRPVILVAQDMPEPHEIDESWLIQHQWILARVLLDESFRPTLSYLTSGFAGDEVSVSVIQAGWQKQRDVVAKLEALAEQQLSQRDALRELILGATLRKDQLEAMGPFGALLADVRAGDFRFSKLGEPDWSPDQIEANRKAAETRLKYVEEALKDAQEKLVGATTAFQAATKEYAEAMQNKHTRHIAIDQLRVHVKQNITHYMQAIWAHEPSDQRYFRLYKLPVVCPEPIPNCTPSVAPSGGNLLAGNLKTYFQVEATPCVPSVLGGGIAKHTHELGQVADLDNPIGYKGNYIIFPLIDECYLTTYMIADFVDSHYGVKDPGVPDFDPESFDQRWNDAHDDPAAREVLRAELISYLKHVRQTTGEIIVPTGQLFIEALPGSHPLLEDFKLLHRMEDVRKVKAEVCRAELENLRLASRLVEAPTDATLLDDPDVDRKVVVQGTNAVVVEPNP